MLDTIKSLMEKVIDLDSEEGEAVRHLFSAYALLNDVSPDTYKGDRLTQELYKYCDATEMFDMFDSWLWGHLI